MVTGIDHLVIAVPDLDIAAHELEQGGVVEWWPASPETLGLDGVPFLIRHAYTGAEWGPAALAKRQAFVHPIGSPVVLTRLDLATPDPQDLAARYARELGLEFWAVVDLAVCTVGGHVIRLVPTREIDTPAAITIGAQAEAPRSSPVPGLRIDVEPIAVPAVAAG